MAERVEYNGYDVVPEVAGTSWATWILSRDIPEGRVNGQRTRAAVVAAAKQGIDRWERQRYRH